MNATRGHCLPELSRTLEQFLQISTSILWMIAGPLFDGKYCVPQAGKPSVLVCTVQVHLLFWKSLFLLSPQAVSCDVVSIVSLGLKKCSGPSYSCSSVPGSHSRFRFGTPLKFSLGCEGWNLLFLFVCLFSHKQVILPIRKFYYGFFWQISFNFLCQSFFFSLLNVSVYAGQRLLTSHPTEVFTLL